MTPARKTLAILLLAGVVAGVPALLSSRSPSPPPPPPGDLSTARDSSGVRVQARMQSTHVRLGHSEAFLAVVLDAETSQGVATRLPVNLAVVIDRSGSMTGEKLLHAKQAARQLIHSLQPDDRFAVVAYGSDIDVVFASTHATAGAKSAAYRAVDSIYADGGTHLSGGLIAGHREIERYSAAATVQRVVLISDGLANEGIVDPGRLARLAADTADRGISITTVGVGLDFDEQTMTRIAVSGRGNYYFAESSNALADLFRREFDRLSAIAATGLQLSLAALPGVTILEAYGYPVQRTHGQVVVPISDLHAGETRKVVFRVAVDADTAGLRQLAAVDLAFRPADASNTRTLSVVAAAHITDDDAAVIAGRDREAVRHIERARTARAIDEATRAYESGDAPRAVQILGTRRQEARSIARSLGDGQLGAELDEAADRADRAFSAAPAAPQSPAGKRARKKNRARSYKLMY